MHALKLAPASVACIPKQLLPLLAVRPSSTQRLGSTHISSAAIEVPPRRIAPTPEPCDASEF